MSIRLTKTMKEEIATKAVNISKYSDALIHITNKEYEVVEQLRVFLLGGEAKAEQYENTQNQVQKLVSSIPDNLLSGTAGINQNSRIHIRYNDSYLTFYLNTNKIVPNTYELVENMNPIVEKLLVIKISKDRAIKEMKEFKQEVLASINGFTTTKKLLEAWPAAIELLPPEALQSPTKTHLPALQTTKLNKVIGLPTKKGN